MAEFSADQDLFPDKTNEHKFNIKNNGLIICSKTLVDLLSSKMLQHDNLLPCQISCKASG